MFGNRLEKFVSSLDELVRVLVAIVARALTVARMTVAVMKISKAIAIGALTVTGVVAVVERWFCAIA